MSAFKCLIFLYPVKNAAIPRSGRRKLRRKTMSGEEIKLDPDTEYHEQMLKFLKDRFEMAHRKCEEAHREIRYNREMYLNKSLKIYWQNPDSVTEDEKKRVFRSALVASKIDTMTAIQTDNRPKIFINPESPGPGAPEWESTTLQRAVEKLGGVQGLAETLTKVFDNWWEENGIDEELYSLVKEARVCGAAVAKIWWNRKLKNFRGDVVFERVPIEDFYPDPDAKSIADCRFCFHTKVVDVEELRARYGVAAEKIQPDPDFSVLYPDRDKGDEDDGLKFRVKKTVLVEGYFKDNSMHRVDGENTNPVEMPKYPNGRIVTFCGNVILRDEPNPYPGFPFVKFTANPVPGGFMGKSDVRDLAPIQENADMIMQQIMANMRLVGNAKLLYEEGALTDPDNISNIVAEKIQVTHMDGVQFVPPQAAAADGYSVYDRMLRLADDISGIHDVSEGKESSGIRSGRAIISLQEGTNRRIRPSARFFESFLKAAGEKILWLILRHYKKGRVYRYGECRRQAAYLPVNLSDLDITFDIAIGPNSTLPADRTAKANLALALLGTPAEDGLPVVDRQYVMEHLDLPGREEVLQRMAALRQTPPTASAPDAMPQPDADGLTDQPMQSAQAPAAPAPPVASLAQRLTGI